MIYAHILTQILSFTEMISRMLNFSPEEVVIGVMASFTYVTWMVI